MRFPSWFQNRCFIERPTNPHMKLPGAPDLRLVSSWFLVEYRLSAHARINPVAAWPGSQWPTGARFPKPHPQR